MAPACSIESLLQVSNIAGGELNGGLDLADVVPSEERECESMANEGSEKEEKNGRGESSHGMTLLRVKIERPGTYQLLY